MGRNLNRLDANPATFRVFLGLEVAFAVSSTVAGTWSALSGVGFAVLVAATLVARQIQIVGAHRRRAAARLAAVRTDELARRRMTRLLFDQEEG